MFEGKLYVELHMKAKCKYIHHVGRVHHISISIRDYTT